MAITVVNLSDPVSSLVTKTNTISGDLGDVALLTSGDSNAVDAINRLIARPVTDSAQVTVIARGSLSSTSPITYDSSSGQIGIGLSVDNANGGGIVLSYNSSTGVIGVTSQIVSSSTISYDSANANFSLIDSSVTLSKIAADAVSSVGLKDVVSLRIFDASGTVVKTIFGAGS